MERNKKKQIVKDKQKEMERKVERERMKEKEIEGETVNIERENVITDCITNTQNFPHDQFHVG